MPKLHQIVALSAGEKSRSSAAITNLYHRIQKAADFAGLARKYQPKDEEGEQLPPESKKVQTRTGELLADAAAHWTKLFDLVRTQDDANCSAKADIVIGDKVIAAGVPVTHLLFLEHQLGDVRTFLGTLPTLDPASDWSFSSEADCYATPAVATTRTKKVLKNHVKAEATDRHPAQVDVYTEDVIVGTWSKIDFSGAMPETEKKRLLTRVNALLDAVKIARETANSSDAVEVKEGDAIFNYLLGT